MNSYDFINSIGQFNYDGITVDKLEELADSFNFKYETKVLQEMVKVSLLDSQF